MKQILKFGPEEIKKKKENNWNKSYFLLVKSTKVIFIHLFYFICYTVILFIIISYYLLWRGDLAETIGAYERLGFRELRARDVCIN